MTKDELLRRSFPNNQICVALRNFFEIVEKLATQEVLWMEVFSSRFEFLLFIRIFFGSILL